VRLYQVLDWDEHFESTKSRTYKRKNYAVLPCKQNGLGYMRLIKQKNGPALYGAFVALILLLSRQKPPRTGLCTDNGQPDGHPLSPLDIALTTNVHESIVKEMMDACSSNPIKWLKFEEIDGHSGIPRETGEDTTVPLYLSKKLSRNLSRKSMQDLEDRFEGIWEIYPRKEKKKRAADSFMKIAPEEEVFNRMVTAIEKQKKSRQWTKDEGQFIPMLSTWLNNQQWEDEGIKAPAAVNIDNEATKAWQIVMTNISNNKPIDNEKIKKALEAIGGRGVIRNAQAGQLAYIQQNFEKNYKAL
jgi:hypothetical protein